ncbi:hypothetical protein C8Q80DRAFT_68713 [Daedaleopsis nitida]|nr:hypothetical protein C8Q80DRAFT_68713 [Daedaleopsis nitida]
MYLSIVDQYHFCRILLPPFFFAPHTPTMPHQNFALDPFPSPECSLVRRATASMRIPTCRRSSTGYPVPNTAAALTSVANTPRRPSTKTAPDARLRSQS